MFCLIAYIPTLNQRHIDWIKKHKPLWLFLVTNEMASELVPRLSRNMASVPTDAMLKMIESLKLVGSVRVFNPTNHSPDLKRRGFKNWIMPDEDVSHVVYEKYLKPEGSEVLFEMIWARWDMSAVTKEQPVIPDVLVTEDYFDQIRMRSASSLLFQSPDWWRQIGALITDSSGDVLASASNSHMPNEYETYIFGDPRLYAQAGEPGKSCAMHAERTLIALCAKKGIPTEGSSVYVTTFPCEDCAREMVVAGVKKVFFRDGYSTLNANEVLRSGGVSIIQVKKSPESI
jgi:dCMP deaminase